MKKLVAALIATAFASGVAFTPATAQAKTEQAVQKPATAGAKKALKQPADKAATHKRKATAKSKKAIKQPKPA